MSNSGGEALPGTVSDLLALLALQEEVNRAEHLRTYITEVRTSFEPAQDEAYRKEFAELKKVFKAGLYHEALERTQGLLQSEPKHPLLLLLMAQTHLNLKDQKSAAAFLYRAEHAGLPQELLLQMKARYCEASEDHSRSEKLRVELKDIHQTREEKLRAERLTAHAANALSYAWLGALGGLAAAIVGISGVLVHKEDSFPIFSSFLAVAGVAGLVAAVGYIQKYNKILTDQ